MFHRRFYRSIWRARKNRLAEPHPAHRPDWIESLEARTLLSAPVVLSESFNPNGTQSISAQFSTDVSASINNTTLVLYNLSNLTTLPNTAISFAYNSTTNTATWSINYTPPGSSTVTHYLPDDGDYQVRLYADRVTDSSGTPMAADSIFNFTYFKGDANGDTTINALDFNALATNYGKAGVFGQGDFDHNGTVNSADFAILASRYGQTLAAAKPAPRQMDVITFNASQDGSADHYDQAMFNAQNTPEPGGYLVYMGTDAQRANLAAQGNSLGVYYNTLNANYSASNPDPSATVAAIENWCTNNFTSAGVQPTWITLNEISSGNWQGINGDIYRTWLTTVIHTLHEVYGHEIVLYSPFPKPGNYSTVWQSLATDAYIGVENYISGAQMEAEDFSPNYALGVYKSSITAYNALGVADSRLIEGEEYSLTTAGTTYGRSGVSLADWDSTIIARAEAIHALGLYYGSIGYAWSKNGMLDTEADMIHFEQTYRAQVLP